MADTPESGKGIFVQNKDVFVEEEWITDPGGSTFRPFEKMGFKSTVIRTNLSMSHDRKAFIMGL